MSLIKKEFDKKLMLGMYIYKSIVICCIVSSIICFSSCGKDRVKAGSPEEVLIFLKDRSRSEAIFDLYTTETISLANEYKKITGMKDESLVDSLSLIPKESEYDIAEKKSEGNRCLIKFVFTKHPSENGQAQTVELIMINDGKNWKIDKRDDYIRLIDSYKKRDADKYLKNIK
ncbi:MAG: hypothetical protein FWF73_01165 [Spirochaetes bacterium]|nr:hypothetical protein [Spirochaetota bacterium]